ncbi:MAG TPA: aldo/keto reductase [Candidatus Nitrosocosmicus sp.]|nr:aldo/keto reductase [Candidatus Nitrosocosmicus sp.]
MNNTVTENNSQYELAPDLTIHRLVNGMWQVAGGHGYIDHDSAIEDMLKYHESGFTSWDLADIYGPAEDFIGHFRRRLVEIKGNEELQRVQALTKWVPPPGKISQSMVRKNIQSSINRMGVESLDVLQFHWWDYNNPYYMDALNYLSDLRDEGMVKHVGLTNFDTERLQIMNDAGLQILSNQIQYSIIDRRPEEKMAPFCEDHDIRILAYGTLCGGLLTERFLGREQEPSSYELDTLSLRKYKKMIDVWGNWKLFQELLSTLHEIAQKHRVNIANIATKYILDKPAVAGVLIGVRLGISDHRNSNSQVFNFSLEREDFETIDIVCKKANDLVEIVGDCGDEYR